MQTQKSPYWDYLNDTNPIKKLAQLIREPHGIYHVLSQDSVMVEYHCNKCNEINRLQIDSTSGIPLQEGCAPFPEDNQLHCLHCSTHHDLTALRHDVETEFHALLKCHAPVNAA